MLNIIRERLRQGRRTIAYPAGQAPPLPDRFRGLPALDESRCAQRAAPLASQRARLTLSRGTEKAFGWTSVAACFVPIAPTRAPKTLSGLPTTIVWPLPPGRTWCSGAGRS